MVKNNILIIGGTGFIGRNLVAGLNNNNNRIDVLHRTNCQSKISGVNYIMCNILEKKKLSKILTKDYEYVINLSGYVNHSSFFENGHEVINNHFIGLLNIISCLKRDKLKRFINVGSSDEYVKNKSPMKESFVTSPITPYSFSKSISYNFIKMINEVENFPGIVVRLFLCYGPGQDSNRFIPQVINACIKNEPIEVSDCEQYRDFCHINDVIEAFKKIMFNTMVKSDLYNIASGTPTKLKDITNYISNHFKTQNILYGKRISSRFENDNLYADINKSKNELGWSPTIDLENGLKNTLEYYKSLK